MISSIPANTVRCDDVVSKSSFGQCDITLWQRCEGRRSKVPFFKIFANVPETLWVRPQKRSLVYPMENVVETWSTGHQIILSNL